MMSTVTLHNSDWATIQVGCFSYQRLRGHQVCKDVHCINVLPSKPHKFTSFLMWFICCTMELVIKVVRKVGQTLPMSIWVLFGSGNYSFHAPCLSPVCPLQGFDIFFFAVKALRLSFKSKPCEGIRERSWLAI